MNVLPGCFSSRRSANFRLVPWIGPGLKPVGYGYELIEASVDLTSVKGVPRYRNISSC